MRESLDWIPVIDGLPDAEETVLIYSAGEDEPVWLGYHDGPDGWRNLDGMPARDVTHWSRMPAGPKA